MSYDNYDAQVELLQALEADVELTELVGGRIFNMVADEGAAFPRILYVEAQNRPVDYIDNRQHKVTVQFQLSIFTDGQTVMHQSKITRLVDNIMRDLQYQKFDSADLYEEDTKLYHKGLRYEKNFYV